jgi:hypothetical protein
MTLLSLALLAQLAAGPIGTFAAPRRADDGLQCGNRLITVGDLKSEVLFVCGSPLTREQHLEIRRVGSSVVTVNVDVWTYDPGAGSFLRVLTFEDGRLVEILAGRIAR